MLTLLVQGFGKSLEIFTLTLLGSLPLGLLVMFGRRSRVAPLRWLVKLFISVMRGTPLMLQLMVVYYGPFLLFDFTPPAMAVMRPSRFSVRLICHHSHSPPHTMHSTHTGRKN